MPEYLKERDRSGRITNNYWGAIGYEGPLTNLIEIEGRFNSVRYARVLRRNVIPMMNRFLEDGAPRIFMHDNSPVHTADVVMTLLSRQRFEVMDWPPKSPDLNPIENVWSHMEYGWPQIHPRNAENLHAVVQDRWNALHNEPRECLLSFPVFFMHLSFLYHFSMDSIKCAVLIVFRILPESVPIIKNAMRNGHRQ